MAAYYILCLLQPPANIEYAALVIGGSFMIEGTTLRATIVGYYVVWKFAFSLIHWSSGFPLKTIIFSLGASLVVAIQAVKKGAAAEGMKVRDYVWRGHDPTSVAVMTEVIHYAFVHFWLFRNWTC